MGGGIGEGRCAAHKHAPDHCANHTAINDIGPSSPLSRLVHAPSGEPGGVIARSTGEPVETSSGHGSRTSAVPPPASCPSFVSLVTVSAGSAAVGGTTGGCGAGGRCGAAGPGPGSAAIAHASSGPERRYFVGVRPVMRWQRSFQLTPCASLGKSFGCLCEQPEP